MLILWKTLLLASEKIRSSVLPDTCVGDVMFWCRPSACVVSMKLHASSSLGLFTWRLKSPTSIKLLHVDTDSAAQSVNSSRNSPFVILLRFEGGGWYIAVTVIDVWPSASCHLANWKVFRWSSSNSLVVMFVFVTNAMPPPHHPSLFEGNNWNWFLFSTVLSYHILSMSVWSNHISVTICMSISFPMSCWCNIRSWFLMDLALTNANLVLLVFSTFGLFLVISTFTRLFCWLHLVCLCILPIVT